MSENIGNETYKKIDEERIVEALSNRNVGDAKVLYKYSSLTKEEFEDIRSRYPTKDPLYEAFWEGMLDLISTKVTRPAFETWFTHTNGEIEGDSVVIYCGNYFQRDWIKGRYHDLILSVVHDELGENYNIDYQLRDDRHYSMS